MSEAELMDRYIDDLKRNPKAPPPPGLDADSAAFVRSLVLAKGQAAPSEKLIVVQTAIAMGAAGSAAFCFRTKA